MTMQWQGGEGMSVRMVCVKAPRALGGLLKLLARRGKGR